MSEQHENQTSAEMKENKMGSMPVGKLLFSMSVPIMISMLVQAFYNIVDSIFVSMISESALTAVSLAFPIQSLMISCSVGLGVGINAFLSRALGEKNYEKVNRVAANGLFLEVLSVLIFVLTGLLVTSVFFRAQTSDPEILQYGETYTKIICCASLGIFMEITFERILQATGRTMLSMVTQLIGAVFNIIMDPILIFGLFGAPKMGIAGAALATVLGQHIAAASAVLINRKFNPEVQLSLSAFRPDFRIIAEIFSVGIPSIIMQAIGSFMIYGINLILISFTSTATAVLGAYFKINSVIFMPVFGLNSGSIPVIAYNYGAKKRGRIVETIKLTFLAAISLMTAGCLMMEWIPHRLFALFNASDHMLQIGVPAFRIIALSFPFAGFSIACASVFQALGKGTYSMIISICRQLIVLLPAAFFLSRSGILSHVWWSFNISEGASLILSAVFLRKIYREIILNVEDDEISHPNS